MNDQVLMDNYLLILKSCVEVYVHGTLESSNLDVKKLLNNSLNTILDSQKNTYELMTKYGWYQTNNVEKNIINDTLTKVKSKN
ncbi:MAG: spore coat protein [Bacilli bacterium]|nr:spore coat protein [Bacilli bacterium]